jgi:hypothetical protein
VRPADGTFVFELQASVKKNINQGVSFGDPGFATPACIYFQKNSITSVGSNTRCMHPKTPLSKTSIMEKVNPFLESVLGRVAGLRAILLTDRDGVVLASAFDPEHVTDTAEYSARAAAMASVFALASHKAGKVKLGACCFFFFFFFFFFFGVDWVTLVCKKKQRWDVNVVGWLCSDIII